MIGVFLFYAFVMFGLIPILLTVGYICYMIVAMIVKGFKDGVES